MADYTSGAINFTGLGNGTDFNQIIDGLVDVEMKRVDRLNVWKSSWLKKNEQFQSLNTQLLSLKTTLEGFDTLNEFLSKSVSSVDPTLVSATADSNAQEATYAVEIGQMATTDTHITTSGVSSLSTAITSTNTSFTFSYAGKSYTLDNINAGMTLEGFVNLINNHADSRDIIRASTIFDGTTYHLQLNGLDQGADNQLVISSAGDIIFNASDFTQTQEAQNTKLKINGFPEGTDWIERPTNLIDDVIEGLTLNIKDWAPNATVQLTVTTNEDAIKDNVVKFINAINAIRSQIQAITKVDEEGKGSVLTGNYGVDMISQNLKNITAELGLGFALWDPDTASGDKFSALSQIGITTDAEEGSLNYGLLKIDDVEFEKALKEDPDALARLFSAYYLGESESTDFTFQSLVEKTTKAGIYDVEVVSDGTQIISATIDGEEAYISGWEITAKSGDATGMAIRLDNTGAGTHTGTITVKLGKTGELIEELKELTEPFYEDTHEGGPLAVLQHNYKDIMKGIDEKIEFETKRIKKMEANLKLKYSRLDALLGQYQLRQGQLDAAIVQLSS